MKKRKIEENAPDPVENVVEMPCGAWCFLIGSIGSHLPTCVLPFGHEGSHETKIEVHVEPVSEFIVIWRIKDNG